MKNIYLTLAICVLSTSIIAQWNQKGFDIDGEAAGDYSGRSVSMSSDGNTLAIGAYDNDGTASQAGHVRVYDWSGSDWIQKGLDIDGEASGDQSGWSVSMSLDGNTLAIGAYLNGGSASGAGHVRVYEWSGSAWIQKGADIDGEAALDRSGWSVSMSSNGNTLAIGAKGNDGTGAEAGHVRVYEWSGTTWIQKGLDIDGESALDQSGWSVSMSSNGNTLAIGAIYNDGTATSAGHIRVYDWSGSAWIQKGLDIDGEALDDESGYSVSMSSDGNALAIGARGNDGSGVRAGHVRVYEWSGTTWIQKGLDIDGEAAVDYSGHSVSMSSDGNTLAIGATGNDGTASLAGHVRVYDWSGSDWIQKGLDIDGESYGDISGASISISSDGNTLAIGAPYNDGTALGTGHVRVYRFCNPISSVDTQIACDSYQWVDGNTYTSSNNTATDTLSNVFGCDSVVTLNLTINNANTGTDTQSACDSYTWIDGNTYTSNNNTATHTLSNANGCDSVVTLDLTINTVNTSVTQNGITLSADVAGAAYQWLDCDNSFSIITGETNQSFTATANGNYALQITENGCVDTSACFSVNTVGIIENSFGNALLIYPNPTNGNFTIDLGLNYESVAVRITDINGKLIQFFSYNNSQLMELKLKEPAGVYLLIIESKEKKAVIRLVKE